MALFTKGCEYGIRACLLLATIHEGGERISSREIAGRLRISPPFLTKVLTRLVRARIVIARRGPHGGVALARAPSEIAMIDLVEALQGGAGFTQCALGRATCGDHAPCPMHKRWNAQRDHMHELLAHTTLSAWPTVQAQQTKSGLPRESGGV